MGVATGEVALTIATPPAALALLHDGAESRPLRSATRAAWKAWRTCRRCASRGPSDDPLIPNYFAMAAPANTPPAIINALNRATARAVALPDLAEKLAANGLVAAPSSPSAMTESVAMDIKRFGELVHHLGLGAN